MAVTPCPVCGLEGGFHDTDNKVSRHAQHEIPRELLKETGWHKLAHEELVRERVAKEEAARLEELLRADAAAVIDDDLEDEEGAGEFDLVLPLSSGGVG